MATRPCKIEKKDNNMRLKVSNKVTSSDIKINIKGAKNALLHLLFAALLNDEKTVFNNVPTSLYDYRGAKDILLYLNVLIDENLDRISLDAHQIDIPDYICNKYTKKTRCSLMLLGALVKAKKNMKISFPGGCSFSDRRPFDIHLDGLKKLGCTYEIVNDGILLSHVDDLDTDFHLRFPSVGATINLLLYAVKGEATVRLHNVAIEPEVQSVVEYLNLCGGNITLKIKEKKLIIVGVKFLHKCEFNIIYDRIQVMTYAALAYIHKVNVIIENIDHIEYIKAPLEVLSSMNAHYAYDKKELTFLGEKSCLKGANIIAKPYPCFPTDLQPVYAVLALFANSDSIISDRVYEDRVKYINELNKMGANLTIIQGNITIQPLDQTAIMPAIMKSFDLRAGMACLLLASFCYHKSEIMSAQQIFRGYDNLIENMSKFMHIDVIVEGMS